MLARIAERIYWLARYLERTENTARLLSVFHSLLLDLPKEVDLGWYNLVVIHSSEEYFNKKYKVRNEKNVIKFMLSDFNNPSSIVHSLHHVKENIRTSRDTVPAEIWWLINELNLYVNERLASGINKKVRHDFLAQIVMTCQQLTGLIFSTMMRESGWHFYQLGSNLERADMVTRFLDAGVSVIMTDAATPNRDQIVWNNVLTSASAEQAYLKATGALVGGMGVVNFLLSYPNFPRTVRYCLEQVTFCMDQLPANDSLTQLAQQVLQEMMDTSHTLELGMSLREYLNETQDKLSQLHQVLVQRWFSLS